MSIMNTIIVAALTSLVTTGGVVIAILQYRRQYLLDVRVERLILRLLKNPMYRFRTFETIQHHVGGFDDDILRQKIVSAGGIRFNDNMNTEIWGLYDTVGEVLDAEWKTKTN